MADQVELTTPAALNANLAIDFTLIGSELHASYEKNNDGYAILLLPTRPEVNNGVNLGKVISDIKSMMKNVNGGTEVNTKTLEENLQNNLSTGDQKVSSLDNVVVKLNMAYLYMKKSGTQSELEYAFQLQVLTDGLIPKEIEQLVDIKNISISVWQTNRARILNQMNLVTINQFLGLPSSSTSGATA